MSKYSKKAQPGFSASRKTGLGSSKNLFICLVAVSLILFTISCREGETGPISSAKGVATTITTPVKVVGNVVCSPFRAIGNVFSNLTASQASLQELEKQNKELVARNAELEEANLTAKRLEGLLEVKTRYDLQSTAARIISGAGDTWSETVVIDKGEADGLSVGMPVVDATGIIGQICECGKVSSTVRLVTDENSKVSAMIQKTRAQGMLCGSANGILNLKFVKSDMKVEEGDLVVTSGLGGVYPKGLPLGRVSSVEDVDGMPYYNIVVQPFNTLDTAEEVLVITALQDNQQITQEEAAEANKGGDPKAKPQDENENLREEASEAQED